VVVVPVGLVVEPVGEVTVPVVETDELVLDARDDSLYISSLLPAPQYSTSRGQYGFEITWRNWHLTAVPRADEATVTWICKSRARGKSVPAVTYLTCQHDTRALETGSTNILRHTQHRST